LELVSETTILLSAWTAVLQRWLKPEVPTEVNAMQGSRSLRMKLKIVMVFIEKYALKIFLNIYRLTVT
jgi:hypothetical protein